MAFCLLCLTARTMSISEKSSGGVMGQYLKGTYYKPIVVVTFFWEKITRLNQYLQRKDYISQQSKGTLSITVGKLAVGTSLVWAAGTYSQFLTSTPNRE